MSTAPSAAITAIAPTVKMMLDTNGLTVEQLTDYLATVASGQTETAGTSPVTVCAAIEAAAAALKPGAVKTYRTYWRVLGDGIRLPASWDDARVEQYATDLASIDKKQKLALALPDDIHACPRNAAGELVVFPGHGDTPLQQVTKFDVEILTKWVGANAQAKALTYDRVRVAKGRPVTRTTGKGAQENFIAAIRCLYTAAGDNLLVAGDYSPAAKLRKPNRRVSRTRRPLTDAEFRDVWLTCSTTGNDPELDSLIFRLQLETASRQEGCINLELGHLDVERQSVWLDQKGDELAEFPVSGCLLHDLLEFATSRGARDVDDAVLRQKGRHRHTGELHPPLTGRRFDTIHDRVHKQHEWANHAQWSSHWLRHHAAAQIEAIGGRPCKMRLLNHEPNGQTDGYGKADFEELAWAVGIATGEPHPLARRPSWVTA